MNPDHESFQQLERGEQRDLSRRGAERADEFTVEGPLLTDVGGTLGAAVLSTPGMIGMMERTSAVLAYEPLPEGKATVGFEVCIKHVAGAAEGAECTATAKLIEVVDERKLFFDVEVREGERTIGVGTHQRRVIAVARPAGTERARGRLPETADDPRGRPPRRLPERARGDRHRATRCG